MINQIFYFFKKSILTQKKSKSGANREIPALSLEWIATRLRWFICWTGKILHFLFSKLIVFFFIRPRCAKNDGCQTSRLKRNGLILILTGKKIWSEKGTSRSDRLNLTKRSFEIVFNFKSCWYSRPNLKYHKCFVYSVWNQAFVTWISMFYWYFQIGLIFLKHQLALWDVPRISIFFIFACKSSLYALPSPYPYLNLKS